MVLWQKKSPIWICNLFLLLLLIKHIYKMPLISVIIPVYNAEQYVASSIESVLSQQDAADFEIVIINDGSKDGSLDICRDYAERDKRIRLFDKPNGGVSSARNLGLDKATGEWVVFLDADDWLTPDTFKLLAQHMSDNDIIRFSIEDIFSAERRRKRVLRQASGRDDTLRQLLGHRTILGIGGTAYRRSIIEEHHVRFDEKLFYAEDWLFLTTLVWHSRRVKTLSNAWCYLYNRYNETSCTNSLNSKKLVLSLVVHKRLLTMVGGGYRAECRRTRCCRVDIMLRYCPVEEVLTALKEHREHIDLPTFGDILFAKISEKMRWRLFKFRRYARQHGLK